MTKNLKKVLGKIYMNAKEKDPSKRTFNPSQYPKNWSAAIKALETKDKRLAFNALFRPLFKQIFTEDIKTYLATGHKLTYALRKQMKDYAKQKAKEIAQAQIAIRTAAAKQGGEGQVEVQPQG